MLLASGCEARPVEKPTLTLMTALPLAWGEGEIADTLSGDRRPARSYRWLAEHYALTLADALTGASLDAAARLLLAQPRALSPRELVTLDRWVRDGGRALILADARLDWRGRFAPGDPRAPPAMTLLDPLLAHWGLRLDLPGRFVRERGDCAILADGAIARCGLGRGVATLVADADMLHDDLWAANQDQFAKLADEAFGR